MSTNNLMFKTLLGAGVCFFISYLASFAGHTSGGDRFPISIVKAYAEKQGGGAATEVSLEKKIAASGVKEIEIKATDTDVEVRGAKSDEVTIELHGKYTVSSKCAEHGGPLSYEIKGQVMTVKVDNCQDDSLFKFNLQSGSGKLKLTLPEGIRIVTLETVSGEADLASQELAKLEVKTVSGDINMSDMKVENFIGKTVSGNQQVSGTVTNVDAKSVSGDVHWTFKNLTPNVVAKTTSGNVSATFSQKPDVKLEFKSVSGSAHLPKDLGGSSDDSSKLDIKLGAGNGSLSVKTVSGDFEINVQ